MAEDLQSGALRESFLGWQCRLRQMAVREEGGRPGPGMRPELSLAPSGEPLARLTVLILRREPEADTAGFRHIVRRSHDPAERLEQALRLLAGAYYQRAREFSDLMTALFGVDSALAAQLLEAQRCELRFEQYSQRYRIPCRVAGLAPEAAAFQATYWHNHMFNPALPGQVQVLSFAPDWREASADPAPQAGGG